MKNLSVNATRVKRVLMLAVGIYGLSLVFFIINYGGTKRSVAIENKQMAGVVQINNVKYKTPYRLQQARILCYISNPVEYLLVSTGEEQENIVSAILKIAMVILFTILIWQFDFDDPFKVTYFKQAYLLYRLFIFAALMEWIKNQYNDYWVTNFLHSTDYHYRSNTVGIMLYLIVIISTAIIYLYGKAVRNQQEMELTI
jgi:amino acid transporter